MVVDYLTFVYKFVTLNFNFQPQLFFNRALIFNYPPPNVCSFKTIQKSGKHSQTFTVATGHQPNGAIFRLRKSRRDLEGKCWNIRKTRHLDGMLVWDWVLSRRKTINICIRDDIPKQIKQSLAKVKARWAVLIQYRKINFKNRCNWKENCVYPLTWTSGLKHSSSKELFVPTGNRQRIFNLWIILFNIVRVSIRITKIK